MSSNPSLLAYVVEQLGPDVRSRAMFGEYGVYKGDLLIALFCDDRLYVKPTEAVRALLSDKLEEAPAYPGAKPSLLVSAEQWDDSELMSQLASLTHAELMTKGAVKAKPRKKVSKGAAKSPTVSTASKPHAPLKQPTSQAKSAANKTIAKKTIAKKTIAKKTAAKSLVKQAGAKQR